VNALLAVEGAKLARTLIATAAGIAAELAAVVIAGAEIRLEGDA